MEGTSSPMDAEESRGRGGVLEQDASADHELLATAQFEACLREQPVGTQSTEQVQAQLRLAFIAELERAHVDVDVAVRDVEPRSDIGGEPGQRVGDVGVQLPIRRVGVDAEVLDQVVVVWKEIIKGHDAAE